MLAKIIKFIFKVFFRVKVNFYNDNFQYDRLIIAPNHVSFLDGIIIALFLPIKPVFAIYSTIANKWYMKFISSIIEFVPIDHANPMAIKRLIKEVEKGRPIVIFPEGRITITGSMMKIYDGTAFIAARTQATIIPVWLDGPEKTYFSRLSTPFKRCLFPKITITVLSPLTINMPSEGRASERRKAVGIKLKNIMTNARLSSRKHHNLVQALFKASRYYGVKRPIISDINFKEDSYRALIRKVLALYRLLPKVTSDKQRIGLLLPNSESTVVTLFAMLMSHRVPALLNYTVGTQGITNASKAAQIDIIITSRQFLEKGKLSYLPEQLPDLKWIFLEDLKPLLTTSDKLFAFLNSFYPDRLLPNHAPDSEAVIFFTSGSEGTPKGVVHTHASLLNNVEQIRSVIDILPTDKFLSPLPLFHAFGFTAGMLIPILSGSRLFLYPNPLHNRVIPELFYDLNCTVLLGTPTFLSNYARYAHDYDFHGMRYAIAGAEKLSEEVKTLWMNKFGVRVLEGYGVTECAPIISLNTPMSAYQGSVGMLLPGIKAKLESITGIERGGKLYIQGTNLMKGYLRVENPGILEPFDQNNDDDWKSWYDTGDIVDINDDGYIQILGRVKRFAKIGGEMISLESVEKLIKEAYPNAEHAVISIKDERRGEQIVLFSTQKEITRENLLKTAQQYGYSALSIPKEIRYLDKLPLLGTGKTDFVTLNRMITETQQ